MRRSSRPWRLQEVGYAQLRSRRFGFACGRPFQDDDLTAKLVRQVLGVDQGCCEAAGARELFSLNYRFSLSELKAAVRSFQLKLGV